MTIVGTGANPERMLQAQEQWPADLDEAKRWIATLRATYNREVAYRERLERQVSRQRRVVDIVQYWHRARGMHIRRRLTQLKAAIVEFEEAEASAERI